MNELLKAKIIVDLRKVPKREREKLRKILAPIKVWEKKSSLCIYYNEEREWRKEHSKELKALHKVREELSKDVFLFCYCNRVEMSIAKLGNHYYIRTFPNKVKKHRNFCPFYDEPVDTQALWKQWSKGKIKSSLLDFPKTGSSGSSPKDEFREIHRPSTKSNKPRKTFVRVILSLIDDAYGLAFNSLNKKVNRVNESEKLTLPSVAKVVSMLRKKLIDKTPRDFRIFVNLITRKEIKLSENSLEFSGHFYGKVQKNQVFYWSPWEEGFASSTGNFLNINVQKNRRITRSFFLPLLYLEDDKPFIPIESKNEAEEIERLLKEGKKLFKVITGSLSKNYAKISRENCVNSLLRSLTYYPDLLIFGNPIQVIEITGFKNETYRKLKKRVKEEFDLLCLPDCPIEYIKL